MRSKITNKMTEIMKWNYEGDRSSAYVRISETLLPIALRLHGSQTAIDDVIRSRFGNKDSIVF